MPSRIQQQIEAAGSNQLDYAAIFTRYPWLGERDLNCIISPDSDGILCGLLMSHVLGWKIKGFYDGKVLVHEDGVQPSSCVFLDMEIFRAGVRSVGQHMLLYNKRQMPDNWAQFADCISLNNLRGHDGYNDFRLKYPFGTTHFLLAALASRSPIELPDTAVAPLLFTDGTWMNLLGYTENSLSWLRYLGADVAGSVLHRLFWSESLSLHSLMTMMNDFLRQRDSISIPKERGDRVAITLRGGEGIPHNLEAVADDLHMFDLDAKVRAERFITLCANMTGWAYDPTAWSWNRWHYLQFTKESFKGRGVRLNNGTFAEFMSRNPLSFAMTSTQDIEFTIENPGQLR